MYYNLETLKEIKKAQVPFIAIGNVEEVETLDEYFEIHNLDEILENTTIRYEDHLSYELFCLALDLAAKGKGESFYLFISKEKVYLLGNEKHYLEYLEKYENSTRTRKRSIGNFIYQFSLNVTQEYETELDLVMNELEVLEDKVLDTQEDETFSKQILHYRKTLLFCKRKYEHLLDAFDNLLENENEFYDVKESARFVILRDRSNRWLSEINSMLEYVTEIREAYQSEVDHRQNKIMSFLTIISSVFLPLTLIVGWYGMNFMMPEFQSKTAYPLVIVVSVLIVIGCIYYFKKKKWF